MLGDEQGSESDVSDTISISQGVTLATICEVDGVLALFLPVNVSA